MKKIKISDIKNGTAKVESEHFVFKQVFLMLEVSSERNVMAW